MSARNHILHLSVKFHFLLGNCSKRLFVVNRHVEFEFNTFSTSRPLRIHDILLAEAQVGFMICLLAEAHYTQLMG